MENWSQYLRWMVATLLFCVAFCGAFNILIDPLGVFRAPTIPGINALKPYLDHHQALARWQAAKRTCPTAGIFGNSRAEVGFDPENPSFRKAGLEAFNHAIPGSSVDLAYDQLNWLVDAGCAPKVAILGVEFFDFFDSASIEPLPERSKQPVPRLDARFFAETVFSLTGIRDSINTIALQRTRNPATITPKGFTPLLNYISEVERSGHHQIFRQRALENLRLWKRKTAGIQSGTGASSGYGRLDSFLSLAVKSGVKVYLVIYPYHAEVRLILERIGIGGLFSEWKKSIYLSTQKFSGPRADIQVWDFSGISEESLEAIPAPGDRHTRLNYYWESGHFKKELGDRIIGQLLAENQGFGIRLHEKMLNDWLQKDHKRVRIELERSSPLLTEVNYLLSADEIN